MIPGYTSQLPSTVRYDNELSDKAKILYTEVSALANCYGFCYASNSHFAKTFNIDERTVSRNINQLIKKNYLTVKYSYAQSEETKTLRVLFINDNSTKALRIDKNVYPPHLDKNVLQILQDNNIYNNINNMPIYNNIHEEKKSKINSLKKLKEWDFVKDEEFCKWFREKPEEIREVLAQDSEEKTRTSYIKGKIDDIIDYCEGKGKKYQDYKAVLRNWINSDIKKIKI